MVGMDGEGWRAKDCITAIASGEELAGEPAKFKIILRSAGGGDRFFGRRESDANPVGDLGPAYFSIAKVACYHSYSIEFVMNDVPFKSLYPELGMADGSSSGFGLELSYYNHNVKSKRMGPATGFIGGCIFTVMAAFLLLLAWLVFGDQSSAQKQSSPTDFSYGILPPPPNLSEQPYGTIPLPSLPVPSPLNQGESNSDSQFQNQLERQQTTTQQLTTQLERHRVQIEQLTSQVERHRLQIESVTDQLEQQRLRNEQLMMQLQEQQRLIGTLTVDQGRLSQSNAAGVGGMQSALLWFLVGIILAVIIGGSIFAVGLVVMLTQSGRRSEIKRYPIQPIDIWPYRIEEEPAEFLPPQMRSRRPR